MYTFPSEPGLEKGEVGLQESPLPSGQSMWEGLGPSRRTLGDTYRWSSEGHVVTVFLPGLVEALGKLLEESMGLVENGKSQDIDTIIHKAVHSLE